MNMSMSYHALSRAADRAVSDDHIRLVISWGEEIRQDGTIAYFVGEKKAEKLAQRGITVPKNVAVIVAADGTIISVIKTSDRKRLTKTRVRRVKRRSCLSMRGKREISRIQ